MYYFYGTRFFSRNIYSPKIFLRVIVEVFNEILEEKTTNEIKQTDLLVEKVRRNLLLEFVPSKMLKH